MHDDAELDAPVAAWRSRPPTVLAVLVAHRGSRWLPQTLAALDRLDHRPDHLVLVHDDSDPATRDLLEAHAGASRVVKAPPRSGFGAQVAVAVESEAEAYDWIWLLHDDQICDPDALSALLDEATADPGIGVVGPKVREWPSLRRLLEVGLTVTGTGQRETMLESGEPDAGQHDRARDVLAVGSAGMLVRRDVWERLGGTDPRLPLFFDDIDFGWRANRAGYRVRTAPASIVFHAEATSNRRRVRRKGVPEKAGERRAAALYTMLANSDPLKFPLTSIRLFLGSLVRFVGFIIGKDLRAARGEIVAMVTVFANPGPMIAARRRRRPLVRRSNRALRDLFAPFWMPYQHGLDVAATTFQVVVRPESVESLGLRSIGVGDEDEEDPVIVDRPPWWRRWPWLTWVLVLLLGSVVAARSVATGSLFSPVLPASPDSIRPWWGLIFERSHAVGLGSADGAPAYVLPLAVVGLVVWFAPGIIAGILTVLAVPFAALTAHRFGRLVSDDRAVRMAWAASYGLMVAVTGAVADGRLGTVVALVVAPLFANVLLRLVLEPQWTRAVLVGVWIALVAAFAPVAWALGMIALAACALLVRRAARYLALSAAVGTVLLGPWLFDRVFSDRIWWEAGSPVDAPATAWDVVTGTGGGVGSGPWWIALPLLVLAVAALVPSATRRAVTAAWIVALVGLAAGLLASMSAFVPYPGAPEVRAWSGLGAGVWMGGLLTAVLFAWPVLRTRRYRSWRRPAIALLAAFPILAGGWLVVRGIDDPLESGDARVVPVFLAARPGTTVVLTGDSESGIVADAVVGPGPYLGAEALRTTADREKLLHDTIESLVTTPTRDDVDQLARLGVDSLYAPDVDLDLARRIDAAPGLAQKGSDSPDSRVWSVTSDVKPDPAPRASAARPWLAGAWMLAWVAAVIAALPVRRNPTSEPAPDDEENA
ncbi:glycosyltransferase family 2 protein [Aeromicrobium duanguangcaii]|uniref:Glycosyltransferase family 2 protein n=1 Tax=Aeromicrobium duanguangcaii TaxID=2968086 RepID=A0ABY5KD89_9ACTN|nr:glycosyltransferase family 2 protein [Aeromicrobium duanguangcaii]MCD9154592.1 glycosyltransferase family 2 protein [Aeromicrobium duanguangcaii]MCD9155359.1 glycosyltransferase family 2 protein [Aeromicrobium duanguangcaii]UUI67993.1 glycosyltransferase family 2 protein [Aeromicrobium duanguangcaii]